MAVAVATKRWTIEELHRLPDDVNKYELVDGQLFVTPAPRQYHQFIISKVTEILVPYVAANGLGMVWQARSVIRWGDNEVEPDLFVRAKSVDLDADWKDAPCAILVVEVLSDSTRRRDLKEKRQLYVERIGIPEYWIADPESRTVRVIRPGAADLTTDATLFWLPEGVTQPLTIQLAAIFEP